MPVYMDVHRNLEGLTAEGIADAHQKDLEVQDKHGVKCLNYWYNEETGTIFCLFEAPSKEAADAVHREAHGLAADEIIEVKEGSSARLKGVGRKVWQIIEQRIDERASSRPELQSSQREDIPDLIRKLAELRDARIIDEDEFETKKAELLKRI